MKNESNSGWRVQLKNRRKKLAKSHEKVGVNTEEKKFGRRKPIAKGKNETGENFFNRRTSWCSIFAVMKWDCFDFLWWLFYGGYSRVAHFYTKSTLRWTYLKKHDRLSFFHIYSVYIIEWIYIINLSFAEN